MDKAIDGYLDLEDGKLYYEVEGEGEPLVLSHAGFVDRRMWDEQWDAFTWLYRTVRYDMRGFGKSSPAEGPVDRREDLRRLLAHLGIAQAPRPSGVAQAPRPSGVAQAPRLSGANRAALVGCSMSGEIMLDFTLEHPEMVSALVLVSAVPVGFEMVGEPPRELLEMVEAMEQGDLQRASELQNRLWIDGPFRQPDQVDPRLRQRAAEMNRIALANDTWHKADSSRVNPLDPPAARRLGEVQAPVLVIAGALDNPEVVRAAEVMAAGIPGAKKVILPGCAHLPNMERPEEFNQVVLEFLADLK